MVIKPDIPRKVRVLQKIDTFDGAKPRFSNRD
jgi:hypothetical protein